MVIINQKFIMEFLGKFLTACIVWLIIHVFIVLMVHAFLCGYISDSTEQKYIRNIDKYKFDGKFIKPSAGGDSLTYINLTPANEIDLFHKWYIMDDVGLVRPGSTLSKKLDSIYNSSKNKYK